MVPFVIFLLGLFDPLNFHYLKALRTTNHLDPFDPCPVGGNGAATAQEANWPRKMAFVFPNRTFVTIDHHNSTPCVRVVSKAG